MEILSCILLAACLSNPDGGAGALNLVCEGQSTWSIVIPAEADALEQQASERLGDFMERISGARLPILREEAEEAEDAGVDRILVGATRRAAKLAVGGEALGEDGFVLRSAGRELFLVGGSPSGTDAAVTHLLERFGCRMWAPDALEVPHRDRLDVPADLDETVVPPTPWRAVHYGVAQDAAYRRWHGLDAVADEVPEHWSQPWVHSMLALVPPADYFDRHPEYFALVEGERRPTQLCLANPDVLRITIERIRSLLVLHPDLQVISVSQADNLDVCHCASDRAETAHEESSMGPMLRFVNAVARAFPERTISTLAYQTTRPPPLHLRPLPNVQIVLCTIEEDRSRPIALNPSSTFPADFDRWSEICKNLFLWDYEVQFTNLLAPFPNLRVLQPNVRWFTQHPLHGLFLQGNGRHTEMAELRAYLLAKLAWNPDLDVEKTTDAFLRGYYGEAGPSLRAYLELLHEELEHSGQELRIFGSPAEGKDSWLRPSVLARAETLFETARERVAGHPDLLRRLRLAHLPVLFAELECARARGADPDGIWQRSPEGSWAVVPGVRERLEAFLRGAEEADQPVLREWGWTLMEYREQWDELLDPRLPSQLAFGLPVRASPSPRRSTPDHLTDGLPGGGRFDDGWVCWDSSHVTLTLRLRPTPVPRRLRFATLRDPERRLLPPTELRLSSSPDGTHWSEPDRRSLQPEISSAARLSFDIPLTSLDGPYLRIELLRPPRDGDTDVSRHGIAVDELYVD